MMGIQKLAGGSLMSLSIAMELTLTTQTLPRRRMKEAMMCTVPTFARCFHSSANACMVPLQKPAPLMLVMM